MDKLQADLAARIDTLFQRCPPLCGFSVQTEGELCLTDIACHPALDGDQLAVLCEEVAQTLIELVDERPEAARLLAGRTFARSLH